MVTISIPNLYSNSFNLIPVDTESYITEVVGSHLGKINSSNIGLRESYNFFFICDLYLFSYLKINLSYPFNNSRTII